MRRTGVSSSLCKCMLHPYTRPYSVPCKMGPCKEQTDSCWPVTPTIQRALSYIGFLKCVYRWQTTLFPHSCAWTAPDFSISHNSGTFMQLPLISLHRFNRTSRLPADKRGRPAFSSRFPCSHSPSQNLMNIL